MLYSFIQLYCKIVESHLDNTVIPFVNRFGYASRARFQLHIPDSFTRSTPHTMWIYIKVPPHGTKTINMTGYYFIVQ